MVEIGFKPPVSGPFLNPGRPDLRAGFSLPGDEEFGLGLRFWASLRLGPPAALRRGRKVFLD